MCERDRSVISILIPVVLSFGVAVVIGCYIWTWQNGDLPDDTGGVPFISDLGNRYPQWLLFAIGFTVVALFFAVLGVVRFYQLKFAIRKIYQHTTRDTSRQCCATVHLTNGNYAAVVLIEVAAASLIGLSWFNDLDFNTLHNVFAAVCFISLATYTLIHTIVTSVVSDIFHAMAEHSKPKSILRRLIRMEVHRGWFYQPTTKPMFAWYVVFNTITVVAAGVGSAHYIVPSLEGVPSVAEWALALSTILYFGAFYYETQNVTSPCCRSCIDIKPYVPLTIPESRYGTGSVPVAPPPSADSQSQ